MDIDEYKKLKELADTRQREADRAMGAFEETKKKLSEEFQVSNLAEANQLLAKLEEEAGKLEREYEKALKQFKEEFKDVLPS